MDLKLKKKIKEIFKKKKTRSFIVAEISANHNKRIDNVIKIINVAKKIGIDAVKVQLYKPEEITLKSKRSDFKIKKNNTWSNYKTLYDLYEKGSMPYDWYHKLAKICKKKKIIFFSSVFDLKTVDFLKKHNCPIYKIASPEITDIPLLEKVAKTKKPVFISTGLANKKDINLAIKILKKNNCKKIVLMKCTSSYPAPINEINIKTMEDYRRSFKVNVGFSDHTEGEVASIVAVASGARVIEKHIIIDKKVRTLDSFFSQDLSQFKKFIKKIREAESCIGSVDYNISRSSKINLAGRKSLYIVKDVKKGELFDINNVKSIRPSFGLHPKYLNKFLGKRSKLNLRKGDRIKLKFLK
jgi:pseudaminic acid synthase